MPLEKYENQFMKFLIVIVLVGVGLFHFSDDDNGR